jgi:hypothetical protein
VLGALGGGRVSAGAFRIGARGAVGAGVRQIDGGVGGSGGRLVRVAALGVGAGEVEAAEGVEEVAAGRVGVGAVDVHGGVGGGLEGAIG